MAFFNWSAPLFGRFANRWSDEDIHEFAMWLRPYVPRRGMLLDLGGGTGALGERLMRALDCDVVVLDPTPEMLAYVPESPHLEPVLGTAETMPFDSDVFDAVVVSDAFHHFRDQHSAAREMQRVVHCGGAILVMEYDPSGWMRPVVWGEKLLGEPGAFFTPAEMCAFFAERGIDGECARTRWASYRFLGTVRPKSQRAD